MKAMFQSMVLLALLLQVVVAVAQNPSGLYVVHAESRVPVQEATVGIEGGQYLALTDAGGFVALQAIDSSVQRLLVSCTGFKTRVVELRSLALDEKQRAIIDLESNISRLQEVRVTSIARSGVFKTISDLDIHLRPIQNAQEVLRAVPGLFIGQHAGGGKAEQIFLRGFDIDHGTDIHLSVDGLPVNMVSHAHGQGYADLHFVIPELIDKVNFNKGPYFPDKGNFNTAGYVAFKTKDFLEQDFARVEGGQFQTGRVIVGFNLLPISGNRRNKSLYVAGEASYSNGYFESPQHFRRLNGVIRYHERLDDRHTLTASLTSFASQWRASGQIPDRAVASGLTGYYGAIDDTEGGRTSRHNAWISLHTKGRQGSTLRQQLSYSKYQFELYSNFTFYKEDPVNGDQIRQKEGRDLLAYEGAYLKPFFLGKIKTESSIGIQARFDRVSDVELSRTLNRSQTSQVISLGDVAEMNTAVYWLQDFLFSDRFRISAGVRGDHFDNRYTDQLSGEKKQTAALIASPSLRLHYTPSSKVQFYFYNGKGFHSNDTRVAVQKTRKEVLPAAYGSDLGGIFRFGKNLIIQTALWHLWLDQEFIYVGDEGVVEAGGRSRRYGLDLSVRYEVAPNLFTDLDLSLAKGRSIDEHPGEDHLPLAPSFTSVGGLTYRKQSGWNGSLRYRFMADRPANETYTVTASGYCILDASLNYTTRKWEAGLAVQNLLNTRWKETQFNTESRLQHEPAPVSEIHFTPGTPLFARASFTLFF